MSEIQECPLCASQEGFKFLTVKYRQGIDVEIPCGFDVPQIHDCEFRIVDIPNFIIKCSCCDEKIKVIPVFQTKGTTLTLAAQAFVSFCYHSKLQESWRKIHKKLCDPVYGIAYTTLYRGYHALGKNLDESKELLKEIFNADISIERSLQIPKKAIKEKTKQHEKMITELLMLLWLSMSECIQKFWNNFWRLLEILIYQVTIRKILQPKRLMKNPVDSS